MGIKLIILLALLVGVLYSLHLLVKDYQALSAPRLLRFLFKRDINSETFSKPSVKWKRILYHDPIQCAQYLYCELGVRPADDDVKLGFTYMLTLEPQEDDVPAWEIFKEAYWFGKSQNIKDINKCHKKYSLCPFHAPVLFKLIEYLIRNDY